MTDPSHMSFFRSISYAELRAWRENNPEVVLDLVGADLSRADISDAPLAKPCCWPPRGASTAATASTPNTCRQPSSAGPTARSARASRGSDNRRVAWGRERGFVSLTG
jgi:hypothetical protein